MSLKIKGKLYKTCVQRVLVYASETWAMKIEDEQRLERAENAMIRWMCGVTLKDKCATNELRERLGIVGVMDVVRKGRLAWFGHLERRDTSDCVSGCREMELAGSRGKGRPVKTWQDCINADMARFGLRREMAQDRVKWRGCIVRKLSNPC